MGIGRHSLPRRVYFVTDADRGYTLDRIHTVEGSDIVYGELHQRATDEEKVPLLPALAIMRTSADLPAVGREFTPGAREPPHSRHHGVPGRETWRR